MAKGFDPELLNQAVLDASKDIFTNVCKVQPSDPATSKTVAVTEYQGRMRLSAMEKFNGPAFVSGVSLYLSPQEKEKHRAVGAIIVYVEASNAEKIFKAFGYSASDDEEDEGMIIACEKICDVFVECIRKELKKLGLPDFTIGAFVNDKNSAVDGLEFGNSSQKQEVSFYFWKKKSLVIDLALNSLPTAAK